MNLIKSFTPSIVGQIVHVWYEAHVFVKYDAWNDIGSGKFVNFPILIVPNPVNAKTKSNHVFMHSNWIGGSQTSTNLGGAHGSGHFSRAVSDLA